MNLALSQANTQTNKMLMLLPSSRHSVARLRGVRNIAKALYLRKRAQTQDQLLQQFGYPGVIIQNHHSHSFTALD